MPQMKATIIEETDVGSFFAVVLGTLLVAFVLPQLASRLLTPKKKKQVEAMSTSSMIEVHMAEREFYRYSKNVTTPNVFEPYEEDDSGEEHDWDDEITVQSFLEVHRKGDFPEFRPEFRKVEEDEEVEEEEKAEEEKEVNEND